MAIQKTTCPVSRQEFFAKAATIQATIAGTPVLMAPRQFSTNSLGFNANQKITLMIGGKPVVCQLGLNLTVIGSKELPEAAKYVFGAPQDNRTEAERDAAVQAAIGTPEVQAILAAQKAKRERQERQEAAEELAFESKS